jgi:hypothetical protein
VNSDAPTAARPPLPPATHRPSRTEPRGQVVETDPEMVDVDLYDTPSGTIPQFRWRQAPKGLATRRQLRTMGLRPGGHDPAAVITCRRGARVAYLYRTDLAVPKLRMTLAKEKALDKAMAARQTCPLCRVRSDFCLPLRTLGSCWPCAQNTPAALAA